MEAWQLPITPNQHNSILRVLPKKFRDYEPAEEYSSVRIRPSYLEITDKQVYAKKVEVFTKKGIIWAKNDDWIVYHDKEYHVYSNERYQKIKEKLYGN